MTEPQKTEPLVTEPLVTEPQISDLVPQNGTAEPANNEATVAAREHLARKKAAREWAKEKGDLYRQYMTTSVIGLEVGVAIGAAAILGWWADRKMGSAPWGMLFGLTVGMVHSGKILWNLAKKNMLENPDDPLPNDESSGDATPGYDASYRYDRDHDGRRGRDD